MKVTHYAIPADGSRLPVAELRHRLAIIEAEIHLHRVERAYMAYLENRRAELIAEIEAAS